MTSGHLGPRGALRGRVLRAERASITWRLRNALRWSFLRGWAARSIIGPFANRWGVTTVLGELAIRVRRADGRWIDYGTVSYRVITDTGVAFLVDDWDNNVTDQTTMNFHGCGTGVNAEAAGDTALQTESTTVLNPDNTRATGTRSQPAANQYRTVGTLTFDGAAAVTEQAFSARRLQVAGCSGTGAFSRRLTWRQVIP